ncbi:MAG: hypothetical protein H6Q19_1437 [Bacteroidetes bacterium]|nr:hypothetical protein [Bacteroidota bacterium]
MCAKLNELLRANDAGFSLDFKWIKNELTKGSVRERHLAKSLRIEINDVAGVENEIRANLLKAGGAAFVPEDAKAFLPMQTVCEIILAGGGIPTYPFLADDAKGGYTDFENDLQRVAKQLTERGFHSVEFITTRNEVNLLEKYAEYLYEQGFVVMFGSEHNTPAMEPVELFARNNTPLTEKLMKINFEGSCVVATHQHLVAQGLSRPLQKSRICKTRKRIN